MMAAVSLIAIKHTRHCGHTVRGNTLVGCCDTNIREKKLDNRTDNYTYDPRTNWQTDSCGTDMMYRSFTDPIETITGWTNKP